MRKVVAGLFISLDGVTESPEQWQFDVFDEDMGAAMMDFIGGVDTILLGRVTYEQWSEYWPTADDPGYSDHINNTPKYVVSNTLKEVHWGSFDNVYLISENLAGELGRLKSQPGKNISVAGSTTLVRTMLQEGLLDELTLMFHPVIVGAGTRLFDDWSGLKRLRLVDSKITGSGVAILTYQPR